MMAADGSEKIEVPDEEGALRRLQLAELDVLKMLRDVMSQNGIRYFLGYGTLLGAVRHGGFIPWDDDVDLFVPRKDYDRLCAVLKEECPAGYRLYYFDGANGVDSPSINLRVENLKVRVLQERGGVKKERPVWVDVFPLDGVGSPGFARRLLFLRFAVLFIELRLARSLVEGVEESKARSRSERFGIWLNETLGIGRLFPLNRTLSRFEEFRKKRSFDGSEYSYALTLDYMESAIFRSEWFGEGAPIVFEGETFSAPIDAHAVLSATYGDYMQLPPESERVFKHRIELLEAE